MRVAIPVTTKRRLEALAAGVKVTGDTVVLPGETADCAAVSNWGDALELRARYERVLVCECGYLGNRNYYSALSWDGLNGRGRHGLAPARALGNIVRLDPWRWRGVRPSNALLLGQVPWDWAVRLALEPLRLSYEDFVRQTTATLLQLGYTVRFRPHPEVYMRDPRPARAQRPLREELEEAELAVTLNSTAAIEAVCMGVPTVVCDRSGSMAAPVSTTFTGPFEEPPARKAWANLLARQQWSLDELEDGSAWRTMRALMIPTIERLF